MKPELILKALFLPRRARPMPEDTYPKFNLLHRPSPRARKPRASPGTCPEARGFLGPLSTTGTTIDRHRPNLAETSNVRIRAIWRIWTTTSLFSFRTYPPPTSLRYSRVRNTLSTPDNLSLLSSDQDCYHHHGIRYYLGTYLDYSSKWPSWKFTALMLTDCTIIPLCKKSCLLQNV